MILFDIKSKYTEYFYKDLEVVILKEIRVDDKKRTKCNSCYSTHQQSISLNLCLRMLQIMKSERNQRGTSVLQWLRIHLAFKGGWLSPHATNY